MARELITGTGNNYDPSSAPANHLVNAYIDNGPDQDFFDKAAVNAIRIFHGNRALDCIGCHSGRGHTEGVSLWATSRTRMAFWQIASFFSRTAIESLDLPMSDPYYDSFIVSDVGTGTYELNTKYGNRPARRPQGDVRAVAPVYFDGSEPQSENWRAAFANFLINDRQFAMNFANRIFGQIFGTALVPAVDDLDPDRLDPQSPPASPWKLQASHPELLVQLGRELAGMNYQLRPFLRLLVTSSVYQLSSRYDGNWKAGDGILFERRYVKRLEPEFLADAIADITGIPGDYEVAGLPGSMRAVQLPDIYEPISDPYAADLMFPFMRGNRDNQRRNQSFSISQQLRMMNSPFTLLRLRYSPVIEGLAQIQPEQAVDELFLRFLARIPSTSERERSLQRLAEAKSFDDRLLALQDLGFAVLNQPDFLLVQ
jgi:hypothetical protein